MEIPQRTCPTIMRTSRQELLQCSLVDLSTLNSLQRILLTTDGTLTETLEAYFLERIQLVKLSEHMISASSPLPLLNLCLGDEMIERRILLRGEASGNNLVYAESLIAINELDESLRDGLLRSKTPIGRLWLEHKLETFKEIVHMGRETAGDLAPFFDISSDDNLLSRTYRVFSKRKPILMITEKFPEHFAFNDSIAG